MAQMILAFQLNKEKDAAIQRICGQLGITKKNVPQRDYAQTLGCLAGVQGFPRKRAACAAPFPAEMLVFSGMSSGQVDAFLDAYRQTALNPIRRKAILTASNVFWTAEVLFAELTKE